MLAVHSHLDYRRSISAMFHPRSSVRSRSCGAGRSRISNADDYVFPLRDIGGIITCPFQQIADSASVDGLASRFPLQHMLKLSVVGDLNAAIVVSLFQRVP